MDTIKKALGYNDQPTTDEPVSGETGKGTAEEPYDAGNADENTTQGMSTSGTGPDINTDRDQDDTTNREDPAFGSSGTADDTGAPSGPPPTTGPSSSTENRGGTSSGGPTNATDPSPDTSVGDPSSAPVPQQKQQGGDRPTEEPSAEQADAVKEKKAAAEGAQSGDGPSGGDDDEPQEFPHDPNDHSGEPLGTVKHDEQKAGEGDDAGPTGGDTAPQEKGTGEQYVKSSGMKADGGDFDATKPGAGREADRLLEAKGIHREPGEQTKVDEGADTGASTEKVGKIDKLKGKLHLGKKS